MTRINSGIKPIQLDDWRLIAELNEIPRVFDLYQTRVSKGIRDFNDIPPTFRLGTGHVTFFLNKLAYITNRIIKLGDEITRRKLYHHVEARAKFVYYNCKNGTIYNQPGYNTFQEHRNYYISQERDRQLVVGRLIDRIKTSSHQPEYEGKKIPVEKFIVFLLTIATPIEEHDNQLELFQP